jgi:predicted N-formylglutamate amidohydrolase
MENNSILSLLGPDDPVPVACVNPEGASRFVLTCEHAGRAIPASLGDLGIEPGEMDRHIAWDIGAAATARRLAAVLDAPLVMQRYSRLVVDCNRPPQAPDLMPEVSDGTMIPGNRAVPEAQRQARLREIFDPYHRTIADLLDARAGLPGPILFSVHSFTPALRVNPKPRPMELGLLFNRDDRLALSLEAALAAVGNPHVVARNEPYHVGEGTDYTIPVHGEGRGLPHLLIEIRNDRIATEEEARAMGDLLARALERAEADLSRTATA